MFSMLCVNPGTPRFELLSVDQSRFQPLPNYQGEKLFLPTEHKNLFLRYFWKGARLSKNVCKFNQDFLFPKQFRQILISDLDCVYF